MYFGAIEAGGTKFVCAVGNDDYEVVERISFPTTAPEETLRRAFAFFDRFDLKAIGIGSFGPIDVTPGSRTYGYIGNTPKPFWGKFDLLGSVQRRYGLPAGWSTDVNIAALSEAAVGAGKGLDSVLYLTVGTGIGGGAVIRGRILEGFSHPEMGHIRIRRHPLDFFGGACPYHRDCLEGMAAGPSIEARLRQKGGEIDPDHEVWDYLADYLAQALYNYTMTLRPDIIVLGGGVMKSPALLPKVKAFLPELIASYVEIPPVDKYLVHPQLADNAGIVGGFILAEQALDER
ncbi:ROK family protein [Paenibacillus macerans]|uniref:ROK family protein n=1 Tax=Paenibacillus macerans TaxID=44252 RepID=UPI003D31C024